MDAEIPEDIQDTARRVVSRGYNEGLVEAVERALLAERERWEKRDDPVTTVYGRLLWHHMDALRKGDEPRRERVFATAKALCAIWPAECQVWEDRYTREDA